MDRQVMHVGATLTMLAMSVSVALSPVARADTGPEVSDEWLYEEVVWIEVYTPEEIIEMVEDFDIDWIGLSERIADALESFSWEDLAEIRPYAEDALAYLRSIPGTEPYTAWLEQRLDYLDVADIMVQMPPPPPPRRRRVYVHRRHEPPVSRRPEPPARKPSRPEPRRAPDPEAWQRILKGRPEPTGAEELIPALKGTFKEEGVPPEWVWLAEVESSLNPKARSPRGAAGLFQFMPATARRFGLRTRPVDERLSPEKSARAAAQYLRYLHEKFGTWPLALAAYNAGEGRVGKLLKKHGADDFDAIAPYLPVETQMYVPKAIATVAMRENVDPLLLPAPIG
jgi:membrane-bound lytic murein transglycosylase D